MPRNPLLRKLIRQHQTLSRREMLGWTLRAGAMLPFAGLAAHGVFASSREPIIILGGGAAGLTAAYRLKSAGIPCEIYEATGRAGGRMYTCRGFNSDGMFCELGGELVDTNHADLAGLCRELGLELERFSDDGGALNDVILLSFGGRLIGEKELLSEFTPLSREIVADLKRAFPDGRVRVPTHADPANAEIFDRMSVREYLDSKTHVGKVVRDVVDRAYYSEYGLDTGEQSALNMLTMIGTDVSGGVKLTGDSDEAFRIKGGSESLTAALLAKVEGSVPIHFEHWLVKMTEKGASLELTFSSSAGTKTIRASQVICALPFSTLRDVEGVRALPLSPAKKRCIEHLGYGTNAKLVLGFKDRIWRKPGAPGVPASTLGLLTDQAPLEFWETSRRQRGASGVITNYLAGKEGYDASLGHSEGALALMEKLYPGSRSHFDGKRLTWPWARMSFAKGSYSCPKVGQYTDFNGSAGEPELKGRLIFAGEHTSLDFAGYMNGAIQSGSKAAIDAMHYHT